MSIRCSLGFDDEERRVLASPYIHWRKILNDISRRSVMRAINGLFFVLGMAFAGVVNAAQGPAVEYSADSYMETAEGVMQGPAYFAPGKERREFTKDGTTMVNITRHDKKVIWSLMPNDKMYMEMKPSEKNSAGDLSLYHFDRTEVGHEVVNGVQTTKNKLIMTGPNGEKMGGFMWVSSEGIVVKMDVIAMDKNSKARIKTELTNIKIGHQDPALFEIPAGYNKMDMGGFAQMMLNGGNKEDDEDSGNDNPDHAKKPEPKEEKKKGFSWRDAIDLIK
jgi:outer membrane lipoprotein-sorting protein